MHNEADTFNFIKTRVETRKAYKGKKAYMTGKARTADEDWDYSHQQSSTCRGCMPGDAYGTIDPTAWCGRWRHSFSPRFNNLV